MSGQTVHSDRDDIPEMRPRQGENTDLATIIGADTAPPGFG
jgi:hypothetical protein